MTKQTFHMILGTKYNLIQSRTRPLFDLTLKSLSRVRTEDTNFQKKHRICKYLCTSELLNVF